MPNEDQMRAVGETCTEYWPIDEDGSPASCSNCNYWEGDDLKCELDIFELQLTNLDQT
ncbi:MAG: hypothetical protein GX980_03295 [Firmicutes bacterium]|jgi:hypothetical protein|nr:hypothetical protein [Bacillota bacterium]